MSKRDDRVYLQHIVESIALAEQFTRGVLGAFHQNPEKWHATLHVLQTLSESATKLSEASQQAMYPMDWNRIRGFRNILVHDYLGDIDHEIVRKVIEIELPKLKTAAEQRLRDMGA